MFVHRAGEGDARGKAAAATLLAGPACMQTSITYTVIITRHPKGFVATCPAFHDCIALGRNRSGAYKSIKHLIRKRLAQTLADQAPPPPNPVVSVKHLRLNLVEIEKEVNLR